MKEKWRKNEGKIYTKKAHVLLFYCCVEHTHKESLFTLAREREREREREKRDLTAGVVVLWGFLSSTSERERECVQ